MEIKYKKGNHSEGDRILFISNNEAITLEDIFYLIEEFAANELRRIRIPIVRKQIIEGDRLFFFEQKIIEAIEKAKEKELNKIKGVKNET